MLDLINRFINMVLDVMIDIIVDVVILRDGRQEIQLPLERSVSFSHQSDIRGDTSRNEAENDNRNKHEKNAELACMVCAYGHVSVAYRGHSGDHEVERLVVETVRLHARFHRGVPSSRLF